MRAYKNEKTGLIDLFDCEPVESISVEEYEHRLEIEAKKAERERLAKELAELDAELARYANRVTEQRDSANPAEVRKVRRW